MTSAYLLQQSQGQEVQPQVRRHRQVLSQRSHLCVSPSAKPRTGSPTTNPTPSPSSKPTVSPSVSPSAKPRTGSPTTSPTSSPSSKPTDALSASPSASPVTQNPTTRPTEKPTTNSPSSSPVTSSPSSSPMTMSPSSSPVTSSPSSSPSTKPTTLIPTSQPSRDPSASPTNQPTVGSEITSQRTLVCGNSGRCGGGDVTTVSKTANRGVRCCRDESHGQGDWPARCRTMSNIWGASEMDNIPFGITAVGNGCVKETDFAGAMETCQANNARLCTPAEMLDRCTRN